MGTLVQWQRCRLLAGWRVLVVRIYKLARHGVPVAASDFKLPLIEAGFTFGANAADDLQLVVCCQCWIYFDSEFIASQWALSLSLSLVHESRDARPS